MMNYALNRGNKKTVRIYPPDRFPKSTFRAASPAAEKASKWNKRYVQMFAHSSSVSIKKAALGNTEYGFSF
jgi:hypothetical protein